MKCGSLYSGEIEEMRNSGLTWAEIAAVAGVLPQSMHKFHKKYGVGKGGRIYREREYKSPVANALAREAGYENLTEAIRDLRMIGKTYDEVVEFFGCNRTLIFYWYPKELKGKIRIVSQKVIDHCRKLGELRSITRKREKGWKHPWDIY